MLQRWLFRIEAKSPNIQFQYNIKAPIREVSQTAFEYQNTTNQERTLEFSCSHPEIFRIMETTHTLGPGGKAKIPVRLKAMDQPSQAQVLVYISEPTKGKHEAIAFTITFLKL